VLPVPTDRLYAALKQHFAAYRFGGSPWLFHHTNTQRHHKKGERLKSLLHSFQNAAREAGMPNGLRPYDLRHTRLTHWSKQVPAPVVQKAAGHASLKTTERYIHLADSDLDVLIQRPTSTKANEKAG